MKQFHLWLKIGSLTLILAAVSLLFIIAPVMASGPSVTITLNSSNTTQTAGFDLANPSPTQLNPALYSGGGTWTNAAVIISPPGPWVTIPGSDWISTTSADYGSDGNFGGDSWRLFRAQFSIPAGANVTSATIQVAGDNAFEFYLNGNLIDSTDLWAPSATVYAPSPFPTGPGSPYLVAPVYSFTPQMGLNTFMFITRNWADGTPNPTGLLYSASITYTPTSIPPTTPSSVGGTVNAVDKFQLMLPWLAVVLGTLFVVALAFFLRKEQSISNR